MPEEEKKKPFLRLIDSIAYFLAGSFAIDNAIVPESLSTHVSNWPVLITGIILILVGFVYLLSTFGFLSAIIAYFKRVLPKFRSWVNALVFVFLFMITMTQVFAVVWNRINIQPFPSWIFLLSALFFAGLLIGIIYMSRKMFSTSEGLFYSTISFSGIAFYIWRSQDFTDEKVTIFSINFSNGSLQLSFVLIVLSILVLVFALSFNSRRDE